MKANELMIGDWVVYEGDTNYSNPIRIEGMDIATDSLVTSDREDVGFEGVEPIPLTMEIINKQGWKFHRHSWELDSCEGYITDDVDYKGEHTGIFSFDIMGEEDLLLVKSIEYVHQLQHVLRLLEIDKEIVL